MNTDSSKITHVIVGSHGFEYDIPHREHRLAVYLSEHPSTKNVYWVFPKYTSEINTKIFKRNIHEVSIPLKINGIEIPVRLIDKYPFNNYFEEIIRQEISVPPSENNFLWYYYPILSQMSQKNNFWEAVVYDCSDNHTTSVSKPDHEMGMIEKYRGNIGAHLNHWSEIRILKNADIIFASSQYLYDELSRHTESPIYLEETGVDLDKFETTEKYTRVEQMDPPRLGFVGKMKRKIDYQLLGDVAKENPSWNIVLVGPDKEGNTDSILELSNVTWIDAVDPSEVPQVMNSLDVGLMPYREIEYNKAVFPLKFHEYLASGLPVVGCGLPATERYAQEGIYLHTSSRPSEFSNACEQALSWKNDTKSRKEIATQADWNVKLDRIYERVSHLGDSEAS